MQRVFVHYHTGDQVVTYDAFVESKHPRGRGGKFASGSGTGATPDPATIAAIAKNHLMVGNLETRQSDSLDFHDLSVHNIKAALHAAMEAGRAAR